MYKNIKNQKTGTMLTENSSNQKTRTMLIHKGLNAGNVRWVIGPLRGYLGAGGVNPEISNSKELVVVRRKDKRQGPEGQAPRVSWWELESWQT